MYFHKSEHSRIINIFLTEPNENKYRTEFSVRKEGKEGFITADQNSFKKYQRENTSLTFTWQAALIAKNTANQHIDTSIRNSRSHIRNFNLCFQYKCGEGGL